MRGRSLSGAYEGLGSLSARRRRNPGLGSQNSSCRIWHDPVNEVITAHDPGNSAEIMICRIPERGPSPPQDKLVLAIGCIARYTRVYLPLPNANFHGHHIETRTPKSCGFRGFGFSGSHLSRGDVSTRLNSCELPLMLQRARICCRRLNALFGTSFLCPGSASIGRHSSA